MVSCTLQIQETQCNMCETIIGRRLVKEGAALVKSDFCCIECTSALFNVLWEAELVSNKELTDRTSKDILAQYNAQDMRIAVRYNLEVLLNQRKD